ncbi:hypothetical protein BZA77DRAFT_384438 [Pyronema omphalodes]|nr:hypothetical protein BZA77DRAFT_384438 [Pyronema omphalodes]
MSTTPTANTLLPPAIRVAKLLGTLGSAYAAGALLQTSLHTLPSLHHSSSRDQSLTLSTLHSTLSRPILLVTSASACAYTYLAYHLYSTTPLSIPLASLSFAPGSFFPHAEATDILIGAGWEVYAAAAAALGVIFPWQWLGVRKVEKRIEAAGEAVKVAEERGLQVKVVDRESAERDLMEWKMGVMVKGVLAAVAAVVGGYAGAWY